MSPAPTPSPLAGRRVLVAEDEAIAALALTDLLELAGAHVVGPAARLPQALALAATDGLDAALLDLDLAGERSIDVATRLRARGVPVVFLTGHADAGLPAELADCAVLTKPVGAREVRDALARVLPAERSDGPAS
jgi:CheY-like chemotaxis protein